MAYLIDGTTLVQLLRATPPPALIRRLRQVPTGMRWTSVITVSQLLVAARRERDPRLMQNVVRLVASIRVTAYDLPAAERFAKLRAQPAGQEADVDDVMIAAVALARDFTIVTKRADAFAAMDGLRLEDWTQ